MVWLWGPKIAIKLRLVPLRRGATRCSMWGPGVKDVWLIHWGSKVDLELDAVRTRGRGKSETFAMITRELTSVDMALLETNRGVKAPALKSLRDSHHAVARCIAQQMPGPDIQLVTGYSASRISILKADPAFQELVTFYRASVKEIQDKAFSDTQAKIAAYGSDLIDEASNRLNDNPETFTLGDLGDHLKIALDRSGNGPQTKSTNVNVNIDYAARISAGRQRAARFASLPVGTVPVEEARLISTSTVSPPAEAGEG